jgi:hypothetical protein
MPPGQTLHPRRELLLHRLKLYQQQALASRGEHKVAHRQVLGRQENTRLELLQVTNRKARQRHTKFHPKWNLSKMVWEGRRSCDVILQVSRGAKSRHNFGAFGISGRYIETLLR